MSKEYDLLNKKLNEQDEVRETLNQLFNVYY